MLFNSSKIIALLLIMVLAAIGPVLLAFGTMITVVASVGAALAGTFLAVTGGQYTTRPVHRAQGQPVLVANLTQCAPVWT